MPCSIRPNHEKLHRCGNPVDLKRITMPPSAAATAMPRRASASAGSSNARGRNSLTSRMPASAHSLARG